MEKIFFLPKPLHGKLDKIKGKQVSSMAEYKLKLDKVCKYLIQESPKAKLIFATTTPVPEGASGGDLRVIV